MTLVKRTPSHVAVAGYRTLISYEGQPTNFHSCNEPGHLQTAFPHRRREREESRPANAATWAEVAARRPISNTTTILDRATDMAALKSMEAETPQATDSIPPPQEDEIGQRRLEAAPQWRKSGY